MATDQLIEPETQAVSVGGAAVSAAHEPVERRGHKRYSFTATIEAVELKSKTRIQGRTSDLSRGGCYVDTISSFPVNTIVKMRVLHANRIFETQARVVYSLQGMGMGLEFCGPETEQGVILDKWISQLSGETPAEPEEEAPSEPVQESHSDSPNDEPYYVLNELIVELMRSKVLSADRGKNLLQKLHGSAT